MVAEPGFAFQRRHNAQHKAYDAAHGRCLQPQPQRYQKPWPQHIRHRHVLLNRVGHAKIAGEHIFDIIEKAHHHRLIQPIFLVQHHFLCFRHFFVVERRARHQFQHQKQNEQNDEHRHHCNAQALEHIFFHGRAPCLPAQAGFFYRSLTACLKKAPWDMPSISHGGQVPLHAGFALRDSPYAEVLFKSR
mgnify:CR=1 FL=1